MTTVAFIGLGRMGSPMAGHLLAAGHDVRVVDVREEALVPLVAAGATAAESPAVAADGAEVAVVAVLDDEQFSSVVLGTDGALAGLSAGGMLLAHSTLEPATVHRAADACSAARVAYVDAPMSGGIPGATAGTLMIIAGAEDADIDRARPVLDAYANRVVHCGPVGTGTHAKLGRNAVGYVLMAAVAEGMALAVRGGVDPDTFRHVLVDSDVIAMYESALQAAGGPPVDDGDSAHGALRQVITTCHKDLRQAILAARGVDLAMPASRGAMESYGTVFGIDLAPDPAVLAGLDEVP